jgi:hypothetical protein
MTGEKTARELMYETNRDVKRICRALQRMEAQGEAFEARLRALEGWRAERRASTVSAGAGGVVAVIVRVLRRGGEGPSPGRRYWKAPDQGISTSDRCSSGARSR